MATSVRLDDDFVSEVAVNAKVSSRSIPKQIEHWAKIGKIAEDNPDLSYEFIREVLLAREEISYGETKKYVRRTARASKD
ncbi:ParD-like family protein [Vibrio parahaemolyticus]|uniref:ParD-like family protein n=1 Tax=Vibrio harveyi group TaxID=717610 RepID=UPI001A1F6397|nr:ParD-like family protein [Vibrio parahaemolyticus]EGQ8734652.1 hypothetical protein [Vibrio parahaemolyticus]EGQ8884723.1 hypothetical protein [Vibrio parahaemolyticus]EGQ8917245.1 hypothetical protein [Vibrio parahaemolyticus]EGQ8936992.1 hypothetical protein [Vibrio parahaemolyticus]EGQ9493638.1 hypothetical protein [Vibrio parahaemolyticus]